MLNVKTMASEAAPHFRPARRWKSCIRKAFNAYLRSGDDDLPARPDAGRRGRLRWLRRWWLPGRSADLERIQSLLLSTSSLRSVANVVQVEATSFDVIVDRSEVGSGLGDRGCGDHRDRDAGDRAHLDQAARTGGDAEPASASG